MNKDTSNFTLPVKRNNGQTLEDRMTENAYKRILPARYLVKDEDGNPVETPEEMFERVAKNVAQPSKDYDHRDFDEEWKRFYDMMTNLEFMPNSPTLMNAGTGIQQLSACFVVHPEDDMRDIFETARDAALIHKSGGGTGYPFHLLRPKGDRVSSTGGVSSGPMSFMTVFDAVCGTVKQGGKRRGAQMGIMRVDHPDVLRFVVSKRKEGNLSNFNISVGLTDDFMDAVKNDEEYTFINPRTGEPYEVAEQTAQFYNSDEEWYPEAAGSDQGKDDNFWRDFSHTVEGVDEYDISLEPGEEMRLPARFIWKVLVDGAWRNGEPGLFMYDISNDMHSFDVDEKPEYKIEATNPCAEQPLMENEPCLHGKELVTTGDGIRRIDSFDTGVVTTDDNGRQIVAEGQRIDQGEKDIVDVELEGGLTMTVTPDHKFITDKGEVRARNLLEEDASVRWMHNNPATASVDIDADGATRAMMLGWIHGDGWMTENSIGISFNKEDGDFEVKDKLLEEYHKLFGKRKPLKDDGESYQEQTDAKQAFDTADDYGFKLARATERELPDWFYEASENEQLAFLRGLYGADGYVKGKADTQIGYSTSSEELANELQRVLGAFGIQTRCFTTSFSSDRNDQYDIRITKASAKTFMKLIGFATPIKNEKFDWEKANYTDSDTLDVVSVEDAGTAPVYDLNVPATNVFHANGVLVHNCNLGHINLSLLVEDSGDGTALTWDEWNDENPEGFEDLEPRMTDYLTDALDVERLEYLAKTGTRFLDNVVTMSDFPLESIENQATSTRKIGLGLMGFAQMLIQLGLRYGSEESQAAAKAIQKLITKYSVEASHELAEERGTFDKWEDSKWADPTEYRDWFLQYAPGLSPDYFEDGFEMRNHNTVTIAPTGTTSMIGDTSGGCEPIYSLAYFKNVAKDIQGEDMLVEFDDYFIKALEANDVDIEQVKQDAEKKMRNNEWDGVHSISDDILPEEVKDLFVTADRVTPEEHVKIQGAFQTHMHSGISKTCNFPNDASREDVADAYLQAYEEGIKGLTVYRDGTRDVQVLTTREENKLEDMDDADMLAEIIEDYGGVEDLLTSAEFEEAAGEEYRLVSVNSESGECEVC